MELHEQRGLGAGGGAVEGALLDLLVVIRQRLVGVAGVGPGFGETLLDVDIAIGLSGDAGLNVGRQQRRLAALLEEFDDAAEVIVPVIAFAVAGELPIHVQGRLEVAALDADFVHAVALVPIEEAGVLVRLEQGVGFVRQAGRFQVTEQSLKGTGVLVFFKPLAQPVFAGIAVAVLGVEVGELEARVGFA